MYVETFSPAGHSNHSTILSLLTLFCYINQHPCSHRGRCVPGGDCGPPASLQTPLDEDQSAASLGRASVPRRHLSLCVHHRGLHRGPCQQEFDHLHLEPQPHNTHGEVSDSLWFLSLGVTFPFQLFFAEHFSQAFEKNKHSYKCRAG